MFLWQEEFQGDPHNFFSPLVCITDLNNLRTVNMLDFTPRLGLCCFGTINLKLEALSGSAWPNHAKAEFSTAGHRRGVRNLKHEASMCWQPAKKRATRLFNHKELNSSNKSELESRLFSQSFDENSTWLIPVVWYPAGGAQSRHARLLTHRMQTSPWVLCWAVRLVVICYAARENRYSTSLSLPILLVRKSTFSDTILSVSHSRFLMIGACMLRLVPYLYFSLFLYIASVFLVVIV